MTVNNLLTKNTLGIFRALFFEELHSNVIEEFRNSNVFEDVQIKFRQIVSNHWLILIPLCK